MGIDLFAFDKSELKGLEIKRALDVEPLASRRGFQGDLLCLEDLTISRPILVLSRLRSGLSARLCGLSLKCQGAFAAER